MRAWLALSLVVPLVGAATAAPQFRASVDVVRIEALVLNRGRPVAGLGAGDFTVTDNGARQTIAVRALAGQPIDVAIALDVSASVRGERLGRLRQAARTLVGLLTPQDRATLVTFDHQYQVRDLYFPHVGQENHAGAGPCRFGVHADLAGRPSSNGHHNGNGNGHHNGNGHSGGNGHGSHLFWSNDPGWTIRQRYLLMPTNQPADCLSRWLPVPNSSCCARRNSCCVCVTPKP